MDTPVGLASPFSNRGAITRETSKTAYGIESFSKKISSYEKGRPSYPDEAIGFLMDKLALQPFMTIADIGAGTGILTRKLSARFKSVIPLEPNSEMRALLGSVAVNGTAEKTTLPDESLDAIFAAQAFHWFDPAAARAEFQRILKSPKPVALLWNNLEPHGQNGALELSQLMESLKSAHSQVLQADEGMISDFFATESLNKAHFENPVRLDHDAFLAMVLSRSYAPGEGDEGYADLVSRLQALFEVHSVGGFFPVFYRTHAYWGWL
jgi:SAM-dependent methyltransferase